MKRLPARYNRVAVPLVLSFKMTGIVSFISTMRVNGVNNALVHHWLGAWALSWIVAFPVLLIVLPLVRWVVGFVVEPTHLP